MEPSREEAKGAIVTREGSDAELEQALASAKDYQLELLKENNRHTEQMRGAVARIFGHSGGLPVYVAAAGMVLGFIGWVALLMVAANKPNGEAAMWMQYSERMLAFAATCVAFIFGKGLKD